MRRTIYTPLGLLSLVFAGCAEREAAQTAEESLWESEYQAVIADNLEMSGPRMIPKYLQFAPGKLYIESSSGTVDSATYRFSFADDSLHTVPDPEKPGSRVPVSHLDLLNPQDSTDVWYRGVVANLGDPRDNRPARRALQLQFAPRGATGRPRYLGTNSGYFVLQRSQRESGKWIRARPHEER